MTSELPTQEEIFDVVDESDCVVAQRPRSVVHRDRLLHRAVHVFVQRPDGKMLIHLRSPDKEEFPGVWTSSASGHVSAGEDYDSAAKRELDEELGISPPLTRCHKFGACSETSFEFTELFHAVSEDALTVDPVEIVDVQWWGISEIATRVKSDSTFFSPAFVLLFGWFVKHQPGLCTGN